MLKQDRKKGESMQLVVRLHEARKNGSAPMEKSKGENVKPAAGTSCWNFTTGTMRVRYGRIGYVERSPPRRREATHIIYRRSYECGEEGRKKR